MTTIQGRDGSVINITNIKFDEDLIKFIERVRSKINISCLESRDFTTLQDIQEDIREEMIKSQFMLNFDSESITLTRSYKSHPDFFALMLVMISNLTKCKNWNDVIQQNIDDSRHDKGITLAGFENDVEDDIGELVGHKCACNHSCKPMNQYLINNKFTNLHLLIGEDCILKNKILNADDMKNLRKKREYDKNYTKLIELNDRNNLDKKQRKKYLQMVVIEKLKEIRENRYNKIRKVINFMKVKLRDKVDFPRYKDMNISWYRFTKLTKKNQEIKRYIDYVLNGELTSQRRKDKLNFYLQFK
jgi:hypothetical protein